MIPNLQEKATMRVVLVPSIDGRGNIHQPYLQGHLGWPAMGVQEAGGHLDLLLHQQTVQSNTDLPNLAVIEKPELNIILL